MTCPRCGACRRPFAGYPLWAGDVCALCADEMRLEVPPEVPPDPTDAELLERLRLQLESIRWNGQ